ncbi:MAG: transcription antitermination factor NusB [Desulfohalobiaceae bacterium]
MPVRPKSSRRKGRERAFQVLYSLNFTPQPTIGLLERTFRSLLGGDPQDCAEADAFAWELISGVGRTLETLDSGISRFSHHWKLKRIARIELTILRLALFEMLYRPDIPNKVAINEAIELSKVFGDDKSRSFVNGILDAAVQAIENGSLGLDQEP